MRYLFFFFWLSMVSSALAAEITDGKVDIENENIEIYIQYRACEKARFQLQQGRCRESSPVTCDFRLRQVSPKTNCSNVVYDTLNFSFDTLDVKTAYYSGATFEIKGDRNSSVNLTLPRFKGVEEFE